MKKNLKTVETGIILGLVLFSMFAVFTPKVSAGPIKVDASLTIVANSEDTRQMVIPASGFINIRLAISYTLYGAGSNFITQSLLSTDKLTIQFDVVDKPEWCVATFQPSTLDAELKKSVTGLETILQISGSENAPAFTPGSIKIKAYTKPINGLLFAVRESTKEEIITFNIGYSSSISIDYNPSMNIGPMDTADFGIKIENLGNAPTEVTCEILNPPAGWTVSSGAFVLLNSKMLGQEGATKTIYLEITPPFGFGYHYDEQSIQVKLTPSADRHPELVGNAYILTFKVRSIGFSTYGLEIILIAALIVIALISIIILVYRKKIKIRRGK